ncbi:MAG: GspH/FimT family pseudopilin [Verrucomicrobia bacterium]|nr:GspH/FimT family pseudopilin [Verrucomicrobiota bacterium]
MKTLPSNPNHRRSGAGFTLLETLLAASLVLLFMGAAIVTLGPTSRGCDLDQGAVRLESILRFARAEAANTGRRVRVAFCQEAQTAEQQSPVRVSWEPEPLDEPEVFQDLSSAKWEIEGFGENLNIDQIRLLDSNENQPASEPTESSELEDDEWWFAPPAESTPITFNPDGSSDSAEIVLSARGSDDARRVTVRVMGLTGLICREVTSDTKEASETEGHKRIQDSSLTVAE